MIIKGKARTGPEVLGPYLANAEKNERAEVVQIRGTVAQDLIGALIEMDAYAAGTHCEKPLYHAQISPEPPYRLTPEQRLDAVNTLEEQLGLKGHARAVVIHEHDGREHLHVVWARIDLEKMRAVSDSHNYRKHEEAARALERRFGHPRVQGAHAERDAIDRPDRTPSRAELRQEERTGITGKQIREEVTGLFRRSDNADAFKAALEDRGYLLAKGDRRDFVIVDRAGGIHSLARRIEGIRAAELREYMKPIDGDALPSASVAHDAQIDKMEGRGSALDQRKWEEKLTQSAINKDKKQAEFERDEAKRFREEAIAREAERERRRAELREAHANAINEKNYARGDDYVSQTTAAVKDHKQRLDKIDKDDLRPSHPPDEAEKDKAEEEILKRQAEETTRRQEAERAAAAQNTKTNFKESADKMTEVQQSRLNRLLNALDDDDRSDEHDHPDPDRQHEAPGGGRTRSR
jgi:Relaxase/Mobilisation nuclease domain